MAKKVQVKILNSKIGLDIPMPWLLTWCYQQPLLGNQLPEQVLMDKCF